MGKDFKTRQKSCMIKDLPKEELPDCLKTSTGKRVTTKEIVEMVS